MPMQQLWGGDLQQAGKLQRLLVQQVLLRLNLPLHLEMM